MTKFVTFEKSTSVIHHISRKRTKEMHDHFNGCGKSIPQDPTFFSFFRDKKLSAKEE